MMGNSQSSSSAHSSQSARPVPSLKIPSEQAPSIPPDFQFPALPHREVTRLAAPSDDSFTVVSYNCLAPVWAAPWKFPLHSPLVVSWNYRQHLLEAELRALKADVFCFQEIDEPGFNELLQALRSSAYDGFHVPNPSGEGIGIMFSTTRFRLLSKDVGPFNLLARLKLDAASGVSLPTPNKPSQLQPASNPPATVPSQSFGAARSAAARGQQEAPTDVLVLRQAKMLTHHNVYAIAVLEDMRRPSARAVVATSHLYWGYSDYSLNYQQQIFQLDLLLSRIASLLPPDAGQQSRTALFICGDFNASQVCGAYQFLRDGVLPKDHHHITLDRRLQPLDHDLVSPLPTAFKKLKSAYTARPDGDPKWTCWTPDGFKGCLDYIFHSNNVAVCEILEVFPDSTVPKDIGSLPLPNYPSDHISVVARFNYTT